MKKRIVIYLDYEDYNKLVDYSHKLCFETVTSLIKWLIKLQLQGIIIKLTDVENKGIIALNTRDNHENDTQKKRH